MARKSEAGFWLVFRGEAQWLAWRYWLRHELNRRFFPEKLPVPLEWPPETVDSAMAVADYFRDVRERAKKDKDWPRAKSPETPIPIAPTPWIRWSEYERNQMVAEFREREEPDFL